MNRQLLQLIKSLHVISHLPIYIFAESFHLKHLYVADRVEVLPYDFRAYFAQEHAPYFLFSGVLDEAFIAYAHSGMILIIGPFTTARLNAAAVNERIRNYTSDDKLAPMLRRYLQLLPYFSLGDVRDFLVHLNYLFHGSSDCPYTETLHLQVQKNKASLNETRLQDMDWRVFQSDYYTYRYEEQILTLVQKGDTKLLRDKLAELSNSVIPDNADDPLRSEKNYTIVILEKLSNLAIEAGHDIGEVYRLRNFYIQEIKKKAKLLEVLYLRDSAIIHFTELMHTFVDKDFSPLTRSVIQYIGMHLYSSLKVAELSKSFFVSETTLCSKFKKETGISVIEYIHQRKVAEARLLLRTGVSPTEVAANLCYYDYAHFSHTFKKFTGLTPKNFQLYPEQACWEIMPELSLGLAGSLLKPAK